MGKLFTIGAIEVRVFGRDHRPPHFHVIHPDYQALVDIVTLDVLRGHLPVRDRRVVLDWASRNKAAIADEWNRNNPDLPI